MKKLIPLLLFFVSLPTMARQFDIEVIIFKRTVNAEQTTESWPDQLPVISMDNAGNLNDANYRAQKGVQLLPSSSYRLNPQEQALRNHAGFQVLMHTAWRQSGRGRLSAPVFHIQGGKNYSSQYNVDGSPKGSTALTSIDGVSEETQNGPVYQLDGRMQVYVEHYLYADVMLDVKEPVVKEIMLPQKPMAEFDNGDTVQVGNLEDVTPTVEELKLLKSYRMDQKRRMRSGEIHYLDNPLMGMIIQVRRAG